MKTIIDYIVEVQEAINKDWLRGGYKPEWVPTITFTEGKKNYKLIYHAHPGTSQSVHFFVEIATGDIYKAASWNVASKGVRGNINNEKKPLLSGDFYR
jgi:hypothetical protein